MLSARRDLNKTEITLQANTGVAYLTVFMCSYRRRIILTSVAERLWIGLKTLIFVCLTDSSLSLWAAPVSGLVMSESHLPNSIRVPFVRYSKGRESNRFSSFTCHLLHSHFVENVFILKMIYYVRCIIWIIINSSRSISSHYKNAILVHFWCRR